MEVLSECRNFQFHPGFIPSPERNEATEWQRCLSLLLGRSWLPRLLTGYPDEISFSSAVTACCETGRWQVAIELVQLMKGKSLAMNEVIFAELARSCAFGLQWKAMLSIVAEMRSAGHEPDSLVLASLVYAFQSSGQVSHSLKALLDLQMLSFQSITSTLGLSEKEHGKFPASIVFIGPYQPTYA